MTPFGPAHNRIVAGGAASLQRNDSIAATSGVGEERLLVELM
jgi:hypothetical protein